MLLFRNEFSILLRKILIFIIFLIIFAISFSSGMAQNYISGCTVITSPGHYILAEDIIDSQATTCIDIQANNVVFDCQGRMIDGLYRYFTYGLRISRSTSQSTNITIMNCIINDWENGIYLYRANNNTMFNISLNKGVSNGILLSASSFNLIDSIISTGSGWYNIFYLSSSSHNNIIQNLYVNSSGTNRIELRSSNNNLFYNFTKVSTQGIVLSSVTNNSFINGILNYNLASTGISIETTDDSHCNNYFINVTGNQGKPIVYFNNSVFIDGWNNNFSQMILCNADNSVIKNVFLSNNNRDGIYLIRADNVTIENVTVINASHGISITNSKNNKLRNLTLLDNYFYDLLVFSSNALECNHDISNALGTGNNPIVFYNSSVNLNGGSYSLLILCNASYSNITNLNISSTNKRNNGFVMMLTNNSNISNLYLEKISSFRIESSNYNFFQNITLRNTSYNSFILSYSSYNFIKDIQILFSSSFAGYFYVSHYNNLSNTLINQAAASCFHIQSSSYNQFENITGIRCQGRGGFTFYASSNNNVLKNSFFVNNSQGIWIEGAAHNILTNLTIINNTQYGIYFWSINKNNTIQNSIILNNPLGGIYWHYTSLSSTANSFINNFFNNTNNVVFTGALALNHWNTTLIQGKNIIGGSFLGGNYWATPYGTGYSETCDDFNYDGICDSPYELQGNNIDYLPLKRLPYGLSKVEYISTCQNIVESGYYVLQNNLTTSSNCINILSNNVVLNCDNKKIQGNNVGKAITISRTSFENVSITIYGCTIQNFDRAIEAVNVSGLTITRNKIQQNNLGIYLRGSQNLIYDNLFNNTQNLDVQDQNFWNIAKTFSYNYRNIINGYFIGGNFWATPSKTGFSEICNDTEGEGICKESFIINQNNKDELPLTFGNPSPPSDLWWDENFKYRLLLNINSSSKLDAYQLKIEIDESYSSFWNHVDPKGNDVRIVNKSLVSLPYWIEYWNYTEKKAIIWFKADLSQGNNEFYLYFGNPLAKSKSNGDLVFEFFDDFSSIRLFKWTSQGEHFIKDGSLILNPTQRVVELKSIQYLLPGNYTVYVKIIDHPSTLRFSFGHEKLFYRYDDENPSLSGLYKNYALIDNFTYDVPSQGAKGLLVFSFNTTHSLLRDNFYNKSFSYGISEQGSAAFLRVEANSNITLDYVLVTKYLSGGINVHLTHTLEINKQLDWFDENWNRRLKINVTSSGTYYDAQVKLSIDSSWQDFWNNVRQDGSDLVFTNLLNNKRYPYYIESWDYAAKNATIWVRIDKLIPGVNQFYMYFGNKHLAYDYKDLSAVNDQLYVWWKFDGNGIDSLNGINATLISVYNATDRFFRNNYAIGLNNSQITTLLNPQNLGNQFSISFWIYLNESKNYQSVFNSLQNLKGFSFYYDKQFGEPGGWTFVYGDGTRFNKVILGELLSQRWYLITITYNNKNVKIYVNNELKASNSFANDLQHNNFFEIGYSSFISNSNLKAVLDDFKIFRKELSLNEVKTLYASSFIIYENKFDDSIVDAALHTWLKFENNLLDEITSKLATGSNYYFTQGKINRAIYFDNAYVDLDNFSVLNNLELSFSFWVKIDDLTKDNVFISKGAFGNNQPLLIFFDKSVSGADVGNGNTDAISVISYDGSTQFFVATESNVINDNTWHHVVVVLNRVTKEIKIYVDGILKGYGKKSSWNGIQSNSLKLRLGNANPLSNGLKGAIDDFKIYSRELSYEEVSLLSANSRFNSGKATFETFDRTSKAFTTKTNINAVLNENLNLMVFGFSKSNNVITERFPKFNFGIEGAKLNAIVSLEINQTKCDFECNQKYFDLNYLYFDNIQPYFYFSFPLDSNSTFNLKINATSGSMQNSYSKTLNVIQFNETFKITKALICEKGYFLFSQAKLNNSHLSSEADFLYKVCLEYFENKINFSRDCSDYYIKLFEYYKKANAHVSLIDLMLDEFCINTDLKGSWHKVNATTTPGLDYSCLFAVANRNNSNIFDCNDNAEKLWFTYVAVPKINEVYCSYEQPDEFSFAIFYCNVSFYVYGNAPNIERQIEYQQYNLSNNQLISSGIASDWSRSREVFVHWNLESNTKFCYRIRARNQYIVTEWSNWSCKDVPNLRPERYLIYVNPKYANYNDLVIVYARAYDPDYDRVKLICGNQSMSNNICESGWELKDPSCSFYFPWNDGKEHILYCRVIDETSQEAVYESEVKIYSIVNITKGILEITPQKVKNGTDVYFKLYSPTSSIIAELNLSELGKGIVLMNDLGQDGDEIAGDRIFTYKLVNASKDCLECVVNVSVKVTDAMQMQYVLEGNLTFDNVVPEITVIKPLPYIYQQNFNLEFQTSERANCTVNGISVPGITYFVYFVTGKEGLNVFNITCFDEVLNMKSIIYNITVNLTPYSIKILTPLNYDVVRGLVNVTYSLNNATPVTLHLFIDGNEVTYNNCGANCISFDSTKYSDGIHEIKLVAKGVTEVEDSIILLFSNYYKVVFIKPNATFVEDDVDVEVLAFDARKVNFTVTCGSLSVVEDNTIDNGFTTRWYLPNEGICTIFAYAYNEKNQLLGFSNFTLNVSKPVIIPTFSLINYNVTQEHVDLNFTSNADNIKFYISKDNSSWIFVDEAFNFIRIYLPSDFNQTLYVKVIASLRGITKEFYFDIPLLKLLVKITKPLPDSIISETTVFEFDIQNRFNLQTLEFYIDQQKYTISNLNQRNYTVDTLNLLDGVHSFKVRVVDVFGNSAEHTIFAVVRNFRIVDIINVYDGIYLYGTKVLYFTYPIQTYKIEFFVNSTKLISKSDKLIDTYYFDTTQFSDGQYVIKLFAYDNRDEIIGNKSIVINILNKELPAPVLDLRDEFDSDGVIYLNWSAIDGAKSYRIYKSVSLGSFVQAYEVSTNSFVDYVPDGEYRYYVVAVDVARKEGNKSNIKSTYVIKEKPKLQIYLEKQHYKPYDIFNLNILASDHRNATIKITISELGITFNLAQNGSIFKGNYTLPSFNLEKWSDVVINYTDITNRTEIFTTKIFLDSKIDNYDFKLYTTSEVGFKEFNESVIVVPYVYYDIPKAYRCYVSSGIIEEFKNDVVGWPYSIDYASYLNYSNDLNDYSFVLLSLYLKNGTKIKIDNLVCNYDESLRELNCNNSKILTLNKINILIKNNTLEILNYSVNIARKNISIETAFIDRVVYSYDIIPFVESCSGLIYVSKQGWNNLSAVVYDEAGNVLILPRKLIYYDPSGGSLDVTPPSKARVVVKDRVVNKNNFTFYILDAKDFEQELLKIPLIYYYELKNVITNETLLQGITNETILNFNISEEKFINDLQLKLYVQVINSANLRSEISETETVTVDLINPSFVEISSQQYVDFNNWYNVRKPTINVVCNDKHLKGIYYGLFADNSTYDFNKMQFSENLNISLIVSYNGVNYLHLACVDEAGNYNYTYVTLKLDDTHPIIYGIKPVRILDDGGVLFEWDEGKDNIGISHYELMILDKDENVIKLINVTSTKHIDYSIPSGSYIGKVRAFDFAGNPSLWSDFAGLEYDDSAPVILAYGPVGEVKYDVITLYVKTDDVSICSYVLSTGESKVFDYTESTHHRTVVALQHPGRYEVNVSCKNKVNLVTNFSYSFYFIYDLNVGSLDVYTAKTFYDNQEVEIFVEVKSTTNNLVSNLRKSDFSIELTETSKNARIETTYGFADFGNGTYSLLIPLPAGNYNIVVDVLGVKKEYNFVVNPIFVNLELTTSNYNPSNNVVYVSESNGVYGVSKKAVNQEIIGNVLVAREGTYFDMFFSNTENIKKEPELVMREFVNYAMPLPEKTVALRIELDDVVLEIDPLLKYENLEGKRKLRVRNVGFDKDTGKVKLRIELLY